MASPMKSLISDSSRYEKAFKLFKERTTDYQSMNNFIDNQLPDIMDSIVSGKTRLNIIGVGSGAGELDVRMLSMIQQKYPQITVDNEVVEPSAQHLSEYKGLVSQTPGLDHINFTWNTITAEMFEELWKKSKLTKKADLIHMFQVLYFVKDVGATISFFHSLLEKNGKLLITLISGACGEAELKGTYGNQLPPVQYVTIADVKRLLDSKGLSYQCYDVPAQADLAECFTEGDENGELLIEFVTEILHFNELAPPELKAAIMELLRSRSVESDGKVMVNHDLQLIVVDQLT